MHPDNGSLHRLPRGGDDIRVESLRMRHCSGGGARQGYPQQGGSACIKVQNVKLSMAGM